MNSSKIIEDIKNGDTTASEIADWCDENGLKTLPKDVLLAFVDSSDDEDSLFHNLSVEDGIGSYLDLVLLKFLVEKGIFKDKLETWFDVFSNEESSWDYNILEYLLLDLKLKPTIDNGFDLESLWQDDIFALVFLTGVRIDGDETELLKNHGIEGGEKDELIRLRQQFVEKNN